MKPQTANPVVPSARYTHRTDTGRRCRLSVSEAHSSLCRQHLAELLQEQSADHCPRLIRNFQGFQTAQGINHSLKHLYELLAQNRISPRRAAVLSYISSLLLRTLPQIDADRAAGIVDPTKPLPTNVPIPFQHAASAVDESEDEAEVEDSGPVPDSDSNTNSPTDTCTDTVSDAKPDHKPRSANTWDPYLPEPDPTKKPS